MSENNITTLHTELFARIPLVGKHARKMLENQAKLLLKATESSNDPDISIVIRTKNDMACLPDLLNDIAAQHYNGTVQVILVDTDSSDGTTEYARAYGAEIVNLTQAEFTYPHALNLGFQAARHAYVVCLVGHSRLASTLMFKSVSRYVADENFGGLYSLPLSNTGASWVERTVSIIIGRFFMGRQKIITKGGGGLLAANCSIVSRLAWQQLGGYDERYAAGGEDSAFGRTLIAAGLRVVREPLCTVFHSHGLGLLNSLRQQWHWMQVARPKPLPFEEQKVLRRRPDLRRKR